MSLVSLYKLCAFPVRIWIPSEDVHSRWGTSPFPMRMCIPGEAHLHSWWGFAFPVRMFILLWFITSSLGMELVTHQEWECASLGMHILTENGHILYRVNLKSVLKIKWQKLKFKILKIGMALTKSFHHKRKIIDCFHSPFLYVAKPPSLNLLLYWRLTWSQGRWNDSIFHNYNHWVGQYLSFVSDWNTGRLFLML